MSIWENRFKPDLMFAVCVAVGILTCAVVLAFVAAEPMRGVIVKVGTAADESGSNGIALFSYSRALDINPNDSDLWRRKGALLWRIGRREEAEEDFQAAIESETDKESRTELRREIREMKTENR